MISYNNNDIKPIHKDYKGDARYQNFFDPYTTNNNNNNNNWNMWNNGNNGWPTTDNTNPFGFTPNDDGNNNIEKDHKKNNDEHSKDKNTDESNFKDSSDNKVNYNKNEENDNNNNKDNKNKKTNNNNSTDNINDNNENIDLNKNSIQMNGNVNKSNNNNDNFIGIGGNITITIPIFILIIIIVLGLIAVAIFIFIKIKKNKGKKEEEDDDNSDDGDDEKEKKSKQKNIVGSPIQDFFKDPTETCQEYINTLGRLRYKDPITMCDPDHPSQGFNFFPSPSLASTTFSTTNPSSSHICVPQPIMVDPQFEKSTILSNKISRINQSFSTSITELDSSNQQIHSFNESNPLIDNLSIIQSSTSHNQSIIIPINNTSVSNIDIKSENK